MTIVDVADILSVAQAAQVRDEDWAALRLADHLCDTESYLGWCTNRMLVKSLFCVHSATDLHHCITTRPLQMAKDGNTARVKLSLAYEVTCFSKEVILRHVR